MPDICMCREPSYCPNKEVCYRNTATWNHYAQTVAFFDWTLTEEGVFYCEGYWPEDRKERRKK